MIKKIGINNFKSIDKLEFELGAKTNIIIGANGSGKTNILEAIAFGAAASANKLDYEFLGNRIRVTSPEFMRSAFNGKKDKEIELSFDLKDKVLNYKLVNNKNDYRKWENLNRELAKNELFDILAKVFDKGVIKQLENSIDQNNQRLEKLFKLLKLDDDSELSSELKETLIRSTEETIDKFTFDNQLSQFLIYTPELSFLKKFEEAAKLFLLELGVKVCFLS
jgi:predicted ATP-dependent endonuclease of OLD family